MQCWGGNRNGELGNGGLDDSSVPVGVSGLTGGVAAISAGSFPTCALLADGAVACWGANGLGQLGDGKASGGSSNVPVPVKGFGPARSRR